MFKSSDLREPGDHFRSVNRLRTVLGLVALLLLNSAAWFATSSAAPEPATTGGPVLIYASGREGVAGRTPARNADRFQEASVTAVERPAVFFSPDGRNRFRFPRRPDEFPLTQRSPTSSTRLEPPPAVMVLRPFGALRPGSSGATLYFASLVAFVGSGLALVLMFPRRLVAVRDTIVWRPTRILRLGAIGLLSVVGAMLLAALLFIIVMGIPVAVVLGLGLCMITLAGLVAATLAIGDRLSGAMRLSRRGPLIDMVLGAMFLLPLSIVPYLGWALVLSIGAIGLGAVVLTRFGSERRWSDGGLVTAF